MSSVDGVDADSFGLVVEAGSSVVVITVASILATSLQSKGNCHKFKKKIKEKEYNENEDKTEGAKRRRRRRTVEKSGNQTSVECLSDNCLIKSFI